MKQIKIPCHNNSNIEVLTSKIIITTTTSREKKASKKKNKIIIIILNINIIIALIKKTKLNQRLKEV